jgi:16S rRNA (guanine966-N2)-methyltransferase
MPNGAITRPTSDRAREGLFSSLQSLVDVEGCRFLDLYAGSGALGLEALSRGAATAVLVDVDEPATVVMRANAQNLGLPAQVVRQKVQAFLTGDPVPYDVVVLDPPYDLDVDPVLEVLAPWVEPGGIVVVERASRGAAPTWPEGFEAVRSRRYGEATLHYGQRDYGLGS